MDEHIKKEKILKLLEHPKSADPLIGSVLLAVRKAVENLPADDVEPVRHGRWIKVGESCGADILECSECHTTHPQCGDAFCRDCGAKMGGGAENG